MAASYRGLRQGEEKGGTASYALKSPAATAIGDLVLFALFIQTETAISIPGMTVRQLKGGGNSFVFATGLAASAEPTYTATWTGAVFATGDIYSFKGVNQTTPIAAEATSTNATGTAVKWPSINPPVGGCLDVIVSISGEDVLTFPAGFTERLSQFPSSVADRPLENAGATGEASGTLEGAAAARVFRFAIGPAPEGEGSGSASLTSKLDALPVLDDLKRVENPLNNFGRWSLLTNFEGLAFSSIDNIGQTTAAGWTTQASSKSAGAIYQPKLPSSSSWAMGYTIAVEPEAPQHINLILGKHEIYLAKVTFGSSGWYAGLQADRITRQQGEVDLKAGDAVRMVYYEGQFSLMRKRSGVWSVLLNETIALTAAERNPAILFYIGEPPAAGTAVRLTDFVAGSLDRLWPRSMGLMGIGR